MRLTMKLCHPLMFLLSFSVSVVVFAENKKAENTKTKEPKETSKAIGSKNTMTMQDKAESVRLTDDYVHRWVRLPTAKGTSISGGTVNIGPVEGYIDVFIFLSSWNIPSQQYIKKFKELEEQFSYLKTRFVYIFTHETMADAEGFVKEYKLKNAVLAGHDINKAYHNPTVPSVYIGDRNGWLLNRYLEFKDEDFKTLKEFLITITVM